MAIRPFLELVRFSHTLFALPFALLSALMAASLTPTAVPLWYWAGIVLAMVTGRTVAMGFNRIVDRSMDGSNPRTAMRHLPAGKMRLGSAVALTALSAVAFIGSTTLFYHAIDCHFFFLCRYWLFCAHIATPNDLRSLRISG